MSEDQFGLVIFAIALCFSVLGALILHGLVAWMDAHPWRDSTDYAPPATSQHNDNRSAHLHVHVHGNLTINVGTDVRSLADATALAVQRSAAGQIVTVVDGCVVAEYCAGHLLRRANW